MYKVIKENKGKNYVWKIEDRGQQHYSGGDKGRYRVAIYGKHDLISTTEFYVHKSYCEEVFSKLSEDNPEADEYKKKTL